MADKLSQIVSGGALAPSTDQLVTVRSGNTDVLVTPGTSSAKTASDNTKATVASVSGTINTNHIAQFADAAGTVKDGGVLGSAASATASSASGTVAAVNGGTVAGHIAVFTDSAGTIQDGGTVGSGFVPTSTTVNGHALSSNVVVSASDITTGTLPVAQVPVATSSAFGAVKPDNSTVTISAGVISAAGSAPSFIAGSGTATASGSNSLAGGDSTAAAANSVALGHSNTIASAGARAAVTGSFNTIGASATDAAVVGNSNTCNNPSAVVMGSNLNTSTVGDNGVMIGNSTHQINVFSNGRFDIPTNGSVLMSTNGAVANAAGSSSGTLTNAPSAGNPAIWLSITINGTTYKIPAWS